MLNTLPWLHIYDEYMEGAHYRGIPLQEIRGYKMLLVGHEQQVRSLANFVLGHL